MYSYSRASHMPRAHHPPLTRCAEKTRTSSGRCLLTARENSIPSGSLSPSKSSGTHSALRETTVESEWTPASVREERVQPTLAGLPELLSVIAPASDSALSRTFSTGGRWRGTRRGAGSPRSSEALAAAASAAAVCEGGCHWRPVKCKAEEESKGRI